MILPLDWLEKVPEGGQRPPSTLLHQSGEHPLPFDCHLHLDSGSSSSIISVYIKDRCELVFVLPWCF